MHLNAIQGQILSFNEIKQIMSFLIELDKNYILYWQTCISMEMLNMPFLDHLHLQCLGNPEENDC